MAQSICVFTGTRAEYGLLRPLLKALPSERITSKLLVSGTHLNAAYGMTVNDIVADGFTIDEAVEIPLASNSQDGVCTSMGVAVERYGMALGRLAPDALMILGDRYEAFAAAAAATVHGIPIIHLHGGEITEGAIDDSFRHAITKMAHVHFASTEVYRRRIIQMGEHPDRVFNVGALGVANALQLPLADRAGVEAKLGLQAGRKYILVTFHPATREALAADQQLAPLLEAFDAFPDHAIVVTGANADAGGAAINQIVQDKAKLHPDRYHFFMSLGAAGYLSAARYADVVVGNSSSAIIEVPSLGVPSIDIGTRQAGRARSDSVIPSEPDAAAIAQAIRYGLTAEFRAIAAKAPNPYQGVDTVAAIKQALEAMAFNGLLKKSFFDQDVTSRVD